MICRGLLCMLAALALAIPAAAPAQGAASGSLSGVVIDQRDRDDDSTSLLMTFGQPGDPEIDEVMLTVPRGTPEPDPGFLPEGWSFEVDGRDWRLSGPRLAPPVRVRAELPRGRVPQRINVDVRLEGQRLFEQRRLRPGVRPPLDREAIDVSERLLLPPAVVAGGSLSGVVIDAEDTPADGEWEIAGVPGEPHPTLPGRLVFRLPLEWPGGRLPVRYRDPWGEVVVDRDDAPEVEVVPGPRRPPRPGPEQERPRPPREPGEIETGPEPGPPAEPPAEPPPEAAPQPRIRDCLRRVQPGGRQCVCGDFPDAAVNPPILMVGDFVLEPLAASEVTAWLEIPGNLPPGEHALAFHPEHDGAGECSFNAVAVAGELDAERLMRGESTQMRLVLLGTDESVGIRIENRTPGVIRLEGGELQHTEFSGGTPNELTRMVQGIERGDFDIHYALDDPPPCTCYQSADPPAGVAVPADPPPPETAPEEPPPERPRVPIGRPVPPPEAMAEACAVTTTARSQPGRDIDMKISQSAIDADKIREAEAHMTGMIESILAGDDDRYATPEPLATVYGLWAVNHVGGYVNAVSKALVANRYGYWSDFINNTEHLKAEARGLREVVMIGAPPECTTEIVGVGVVRQIAHSYAHDPAAQGIEVLRGLNTVGKLAMEVAKAFIGAGGASAAGRAAQAAIARKALQDAIADHVKGEIKDAAVEELARRLESADLADPDDVREIAELIDAIKDDKLAEKLLKDLSDELGTAIKWLTLDLEPADFAPVGSDTFTRARGTIDIQVGATAGQSLAESNVLYRRESLDDDPEDVMHGGGTHCPAPVILEDIQQGSMTSTIRGEAALEGQAQGNGLTNGYLASSVVLAKIGVCSCPDGTWSMDSHFEHGYFSGRPEPGLAEWGLSEFRIQGSVLEDRFNRYLESFDGRDTTPGRDELRDGLGGLAEEWAAEYPACGES